MVEDFEGSNLAHVGNAEQRTIISGIVPKAKGRVQCLFYLYGILGVQGSGLDRLQHNGDHLFRSQKEEKVSKAKGQMEKAEKAKVASAMAMQLIWLMIIH